MRRMSTCITVAAALATLTAGGCGSDQPPVCDSLAAVQTSLDHVRNTNISENGLSQLQADVSQLRADLIQLRTDGQVKFATEIEGVRGAVNQFAASVAAARATPNATTLGAVGTAKSGVQESVRRLGDAMSGTC
jgi:hypothetical protein